MLEKDEVRRGGIRRLIMKLSIRSGLLPNSLLITDVVMSSSESVAGGGFADIFRGTYKGRLVALKRLRVFRSTHDPEAWKVSHNFSS